ncbi:uncharacterized protein LOC125552688 isoform X2 [Triticum urartu]|uniref:uncharacterized protein LOC125552688 isoform X2 n=1 Tax=Triticum urartu TaxID=4572 RepID=UPI0020446132|nr:uncharacterized protein LOC125552688 isoform X2 [Triticum urartu]
MCSAAPPFHRRTTTPPAAVQHSSVSPPAWPPGCNSPPRLRTTTTPEMPHAPSPAVAAAHTPRWETVDLLSSMPSTASATTTTAMPGGRDHNHDSEERDDAHYSFLQVKKGYVLITRMESITSYKNQYGQHRSGQMFMTFKLPLTFAIIRKILDRLIFKTVNSFTGTQEQLGTHVAANDMCALDEWPSHARRNRAQLWNESDGQNKKGRGVLFVFRTKHLKRFKTKKMKLKVQFPVNIEAIFSRPHRKALRNATHHSLMGMDTWPNHQVVLKRIKSQFEEQARATAEIQKVNSELSHQVTELQDQLQAERESTQERINFERAERENLEESLKEEHADMERLLEEERRSTLKFEKNMMAKFAQLSQHTQTHQTASTTGTLGTRHNVIAPNTLIQAATIRMFRAMDPKIN